MTPWVTRLLVTNVIVALVLQPGTLPYALLTLFPPAVVGLDQVYIPGMPFRPWTLFTYMFLHAGLMHLLFNMIGLFFFGPRLESRLGSKGFLGLYFLSGLGGAAFSFAFSYGAPVVGASAAVYGILIGFAMYWPRELIYIYGVVPVQARWLALFIVAISLYSGITGSDGGTAHFAHLGGLAVGAGFLRLRDRRLGKGRRDFQRRVNHSPSLDVSERDARRRWAAIDLASIHDLNRNEVEELLARVDRHGMGALSPEERRFLDRMSTGL
jgi:membrane associated rhomboid family serine protease